MDASTGVECAEGYSLDCMRVSQQHEEHDGIKRLDEKGGLERQPRADLSNGYYRNPILAGKYADPSIVRVGEDYHMTHSGGGAPGVLIWPAQMIIL
jgi:hypothetical protein